MPCNTTCISGQTVSVIWDGQLTVAGGSSTWVPIAPTVLGLILEMQLTDFARISGQIFSLVVPFNVQVYQYRTSVLLGGVQAGGTIINSAPDPNTGIEIATILDDVAGKFAAFRVYDAVQGVGRPDFVVQAYLTLRPI